MLKRIIVLLLFPLISYTQVPNESNLKKPELEAAPYELLRDYRYSRVIDKLKEIRLAQIAFKSIKGRYSDSFKELIAFIENEKFPIIQKRDSTYWEYDKEYRIDMLREVTIIDTLSYVNIKDSLFKYSEYYKKMAFIPINGIDEKFSIKTDLINKGKYQDIPVFEIRVPKKLILFDQDKYTITSEERFVSVDGINGPDIVLGSLSEVSTNGNWPTTFDDEYSSYMQSAICFNWITNLNKTSSPNPKLKEDLDLIMNAVNKKMDIKVAYCKTLESGAFSAVIEEDAFILLSNEVYENNLTRFTLAHEFSHIYYNDFPNNLENPDPMIMRSEIKKVAELYADELAGYILNKLNSPIEGLLMDLSQMLLKRDLIFGTERTNYPSSEKRINALEKGYKRFEKESNIIGYSPKLEAEWLVNSDIFVDEIYKLVMTTSQWKLDTTRIYFRSKKSLNYIKFVSTIKNLSNIIDEQLDLLRYYVNLNKDGPVDLFGEIMDNPNQEAFLDSYNKSLMKIKNNTLKMKFMWPKSFNSQYNNRLLYYFNLQQNLEEYKTAVDKALGQSDWVIRK